MNGAINVMEFFLNVPPGAQLIITEHPNATLTSSGQPTYLFIGSGSNIPEVVCNPSSYPSYPGYGYRRRAEGGRGKQQVGGARRSDAEVCWVDGFCDVEGGENATSCRVDCPCNNNSVCDDAHGENPTNCLDDCHCGDGICDTVYMENATSCPGDCPCNSDGNCDDGETASLCSNDCSCGDDICDSSETTTSCSPDCNPGPGDTTWTGTGTGTGAGGGIQASCQCATAFNYCGDGVCNLQVGETFKNCPKDCPLKITSKTGFVKIQVIFCQAPTGIIDQGFTLGLKTYVSCSTTPPCLSPLSARMEAPSWCRLFFPHLIRRICGTHLAFVATALIS